MGAYSSRVQFGFDRVYGSAQYDMIKRRESGLCSLLFVYNVFFRMYPQDEIRGVKRRGKNYQYNGLKIIHYTCKER